MISNVTAHLVNTGIIGKLMEVFYYRIFHLVVTTGCTGFPVFFGYKLHRFPVFFGYKQIEYPMIKYMIQEVSGLHH